MMKPEGILLINKPPGKTSFYLVNVLRKILGVKKIGHAGTLDPFATGVMVMLIGRNYTRLSDRFLMQDKVYRAIIKLGEVTDTYDCDGQILSASEKQPSLEEIKQALTRFQGQIQQTPPMFSAKKVNGQKLCDLARKGLEIERKPVAVSVKTELLAYNYPFLEVEIACSKGTYVRSIAHDLGQILGCGAHLASLVRLQSGSYTLDSCVNLEDLNPQNALQFIQS
jgi:tRNA pseudouridine55 synthase